MFIKWIKCRVQASNRARFSAAQEKWNELESILGFLMQAGGWNEADANEACILAVWENKQAYDHFMREAHDAIYERSKQKGTFKELSISAFTVKPLSSSIFSEIQRFIPNSKYMVVGRAITSIDPTDAVNVIRGGINDQLIESVVFNTDQGNYVIVFLSEKFDNRLKEIFMDYTIVKLQLSWSVLREN